MLLRQTWSRLPVTSWVVQSCQLRVVVNPRSTFCSRRGDNDGRGHDSEDAGVISSQRRSGTPLMPKLPVPKVEDTLSKYLTVLSTVLSPYELHVTTQHVTEFMTPGGWGDTLQAYLLKRHSDTDNWASDWWLRNMYLENRLPLPINSNPATFSQTRHYASKEDYLRGTLPVEMANKTEPLCMEQEYRIMSSYRRPGIPSDQLLTGLGDQRPAFFVVACRNQFYRVAVEQDGVGLSEGELYSQLCKVMTAAQHHTAGSPPMGILTTLDRSMWAEVRERLAAVAENSSNLDTIENSLFLLCLDKPIKPASSSSTSASSSPSTTEEEKGEEELVNLSHYALHGQGTEFNSCNRWFDMPLQISLSEDGSSATVAEHSVAEGGALIAPLLYAHTYCLSTQAGCEEGEARQESRCLRDPVWLTWTTTSEIDTYIDRAKDTMDRNIANIDICLGRFDEVGGHFAKKQGVSPDAFVQLALQLAYYRLHGRMAMSYESATLRRFRSGRVDNIRANSPAALAWIQAMCGEILATGAQKQSLFRAAAEWLKSCQIEAVMGYGIDCHLIGLREAARDLNVLGSIPLFSDPAFRKAFHFTLSTSQMNMSPLGFYGPTVPDGYGIPYGLYRDHVDLVITSFRDCAETDSQKFIKCLRSCFLEMRDNCLKTGDLYARNNQNEPCEHY